MPGGQEPHQRKTGMRAHDGGRLLVHVGQGPRPLFAAPASPSEHTGDRASLRRRPSPFVLLLRPTATHTFDGLDDHLRAFPPALPRKHLDRLCSHITFAAGIFFPPSWLAPSAHSYVGHSFQRGFRHKMATATQVRSHYAGKNRIIARLTSYGALSEMGVIHADTMEYLERAGTGNISKGENIKKQGRHLNWFDEIYAEHTKYQHVRRYEAILFSL